MRVDRSATSSGNARTLRRIRTIPDPLWFPAKPEAKEEAIRATLRAMEAKAGLQAMAARGLAGSASTSWTRTEATDRSMTSDKEILSSRSETGRYQSERQEGPRI